MAIPSNPRIPNFIRKAAASGSLLTGILLLIWALVHLNLAQPDDISISLKRFCLGLGSLLALLGAAMHLRKNFIGLNLRTLIAACTWLYLFLEISRYGFILTGFVHGRNHASDGSWGYFSYPIAEFDSIHGYHWLDWDADVIKYVNGETVFYQVVRPNNKNWISKIDYYLRKKDGPTIFDEDTTHQRWMVFGDSFTGSEFLSETWVDQANAQLRALHRGNHPPELYNFGLDGGGLWNWHSTFFGDVVPNYEFDGIVLAVYGNDFDRDFAIMHHTDSVAWFKYFDSKPTSQKDFQENYLPKMDWSAPVGPSGIIHGKKRSLPRLDLYFLMRLHDALDRIQLKQRQKKYQQKYLDSKSDKLETYAEANFVERYGQNKWDLLSQMIEHCQAHGKEVIFASIPDEQGLHFNKRGDFTVVQGELAWLAQHFNARYFDGYEVFADIPDEELNQFYLKYDPHWNEKGATKFGQAMARFLVGGP
ncbi:MAG: hypothetical protein H6581_19785 [Bacteroidia bacterium]|nr:hypothetical protein [Bacteroidia bacterium]